MGSAASAESVYRNNNPRDGGVAAELFQPIYKKGAKTHRYQKHLRFMIKRTADPAMREPFL